MLVLYCKSFALECSAHIEFSCTTEEKLAESECCGKAAYDLQATNVHISLLFRRVLWYAHNGACTHAEEASRLFVSLSVCLVSYLEGFEFLK